MDVRLIGIPTVRVEGREGRLTGRQPALLARLALSVPNPVSRDSLIDAIWGENLPVDPTNALHQRISGLRRVIEGGGSREVLITSEWGYALHLEPEEIDIHRFAQLAETGNDCLRSKDYQRALEILDGAHELWRGDPFEGFGHEPWAISEAQRLDELHLRALEDRFEARLGLGEGDALVSDLTEFVSSNPYRERACGQLMQALYRSGRQADALSLYDRTRELLLDGLGVSPGQGLQSIYERVLEQDSDLTPDQDNVTVRRSHTSGNIPAPVSSVIGREVAVEQVAQLLSHGRLVTLTGPGGAGKTTLALETARRVAAPPDGSWLVELAPLVTGDAIVETIAKTLGLGGAVLGAAAIDLDTLGQALSELDVLVILDNCEHVVSDVAMVAETLLGSAPGLNLLVTSREPIGLPGELIWSVPALTTPGTGEQTPDAVSASGAGALFLDRVRSHTPSFSIDEDNAAPVEKILRELDGIPLAIELAAARARAHTMEEIASGLERRLEFSGRGRTTPSRQRTLRETMNWSWQLLSEDEQLAWAALSVVNDRIERDFAAPLLDAVETPRPHADVLTDLVDRSVLMVSVSGDRSRFRMLETIRAYGNERLIELGLDSRLRATHAGAVVERLSRCHDRRDPARWGVDLSGVETSLSEARSALAWAESQRDALQMQRISGLLGWFWLLSGHQKEGIQWLDAALGAVEGQPPPDLVPEDCDAHALLWASGLRSSKFDPYADAWAGLSLLAELPPADSILAQVFAAVHTAHRGEIDDALEDLLCVVNEAGAIGGWPLGFAHITLSQIARLSGRREMVREHGPIGLELVTAANVDWAQMLAIEILVDDIETTGDFVRVKELAERGLSLCRGQHVPEVEALLLLKLATAQHELGDPDGGRRSVEQALELGRAGGRRPTLGYMLLHGASLARRRGDLDEARALLDEAADMHRGIGTDLGATRAAIELALLQVAEETTDGLVAARQCLQSALDLGDPYLVVKGLGAAAAAAAAHGRHETAKGSIDVITALVENGHARIPNDVWEDLARYCEPYVGQVESPEASTDPLTLPPLSEADVGSIVSVIRGLT